MYNSISFKDWIYDCNKVSFIEEIISALKSPLLNEEFTDGSELAYWANIIRWNAMLERDGTFPEEARKAGFSERDLPSIDDADAKFAELLPKAFNAIAGNKNFEYTGKSKDDLEQDTWIATRQELMGKDQEQEEKPFSKLDGKVTSFISSRLIKIISTTKEKTGKKIEQKTRQKEKVARAIAGPAILAILNDNHPLHDEFEQWKEDYYERNIPSQNAKRKEQGKDPLKKKMPEDDIGKVKAFADYDSIQVATNPNNPHHEEFMQWSADHYPNNRNPKGFLVSVKQRVKHFDWVASDKGQVRISKQVTQATDMPEDIPQSKVYQRPQQEFSPKAVQAVSKALGVLSSQNPEAAAILKVAIGKNKSRAQELITGNLDQAKGYLSALENEDKAQILRIGKEAGVQGDYNYILGKLREGINFVIDVVTRMGLVEL